MGKLLPFGKPSTLRIDSAQPNQANQPKPQPLNESELKACEIAKALKNSFSDAFIEQVKQELSQEDEVNHD
jgi:hypothetical protein